MRNCYNFYTELPPIQKLRFFLSFDSVVGMVCVFIFFFRILTTLFKGSVFVLSFPILLATFPIFYHYMRRNSSYRGNAIPPKNVLENLRCWLIYRAIVVAIFLLLCLIFILWGLILLLTEGAEAKAAASKVGLGDQAGKMFSSFFSYMTKGADIEAVMLLILAVTEFFMVKYVKELLDEHNSNFEAQMVRDMEGKEEIETNTDQEAPLL